MWDTTLCLKAMSSATEKLLTFTVTCSFRSTPLQCGRSSWGDSQLSKWTRAVWANRLCNLRGVRVISQFGQNVLDLSWQVWWHCLTLFLYLHDVHLFQQLNREAQL